MAAFLIENNMYELPSLGITDYVVFTTVIGISFAIGLLSSIKAKNSAEDFLTANRSMHFLPVGFSLLTSYISSISLLGMSGDTYANGMQLYMVNIGGVLGVYATTYTSLPVFAKLQLTSMNEYLVLRFKSHRLKTFVSILFIFRKMLYMGICLYAPTIALAAVTSLDINTYIYILGVVCTIYSSVGGLRAVIWTDVFQLIFMSVGIVVICGIGWHEVGSLSEIWSISSAGNRTELFDVNPDPTIRHTLWTVFLHGFFFQSFIFGIDQLNLQRISSVPTESAARKVLLVTAIGMLTLYVFVFFSGLITYAIYGHCDPLTLGIIDKKEEILPYFIMDRASVIYGLPGLFIATLFSGTLSSLSSALNGTVAMIWKDFLEKLPYFKNSSDAASALINKALSLVIGFTTIGIAILCTKTKSLVDVTSIVSSVAVGPVYGVFLLGLLFPGCCYIGAWAGLLSSLSFILWVAVGSSLYGPPVSHLPYSIDECNATEKLSLMASSVNWTMGYEEPEYVRPPQMLNVYLLSYALYTAVSTLLSFAVGVIATYITGLQSLDNVSQELISPFVRKICWKKPEELMKMKENEEESEDQLELTKKLLKDEVVLHKSECMKTNDTYKTDILLKTQ